MLNFSFVVELPWHKPYLRRGLEDNTPDREAEWEKKAAQSQRRKHGTDSQGDPPAMMLAPTGGSGAIYSHKFKAAWSLGWRLMPTGKDGLDSDRIEIPEEQSVDRFGPRWQTRVNDLLCRCNYGRICWLMSHKSSPLLYFILFTYQAGTVHIISVYTLMQMCCS